MIGLSIKSAIAMGARFSIVLLSTAINGPFIKAFCLWLSIINIEDMSEKSSFLSWSTELLLVLLQNREQRNKTPICIQLWASIRLSYLDKDLCICNLLLIYTFHYPACGGFDIFTSTTAATYSIASTTRFLQIPLLEIYRACFFV